MPVDSHAISRHLWMWLARMSAFCAKIRSRADGQRRSGGNQLGRLGYDINQGTVAHDGDRQRAADGLIEHQPLQVLGFLHGLTARAAAHFST